MITAANQQVGKGPRCPVLHCFTRGSGKCSDHSGSITSAPHCPHCFTNILFTTSMVVSGCIPLSDLSLDCAETSTDALMIRRPMLQIILWLTALLAIWMVLGFAIWSRATNGLWPPWTGIGEYVGPHHSADQLFQREKTLWDWLQLLVVPAALAILVFWLNGRRAQTDHEIAEEKSQDELVVKYLELMSQLLLDHDLRNSEQDSEVRNVARARTLDVLRKLKPARKLGFIAVPVYVWPNRPTSEGRCFIIKERRSE